MLNACFQTFVFLVKRRFASVTKMFIGQWMNDPSCETSLQHLVTNIRQWWSGTLRKLSQKCDIPQNIDRIALDIKTVSLRNERENDTLNLVMVGRSRHRIASSYNRKRKFSDEWIPSKEDRSQRQTDKVSLQMSINKKILRSYINPTKFQQHFKSFWTSS